MTMENLKPYWVEGEERFSSQDSRDSRGSSSPVAAFSEDLQQKIRSIQKGLQDVHPHDYAYWESGFLHDLDPEKEIKNWYHLTQVYQEAATEFPDKATREDIFHILLACMNGNRDQVYDWINMVNLAQNEAEQIINGYFNPGN
jgi:hypothetical protein